MKTLSKLAAFFAASVLVFAACSKDEEKSDPGPGPVGPEPIVPLVIPSSNTAARYNVTSEGGLIDFVEIVPTTGNYIVGERQAASGVKTRADKDVVRVVEGKFTAKEDNEYQLNGWGTVIVKFNEAGDGFLLSATPTDGATVELPVTLQKSIAYDATTTQMSAAWELATVRIDLKVLKDEFNRECTLEELPQLQEDLIPFLESVVDDLPESIRESVDIYEMADFSDLTSNPLFFNQVQFTTTGTAITKRPEECVVASWRWTESGKSFVISFPDQGDNTAGVSFRNDQLCIEPVIPQVEEIKAQMGAFVTLAFSCRVFVYFDKVN